MALNVVLVDGVKNENNEYVAPSIDKLTDESIKFKMVDGKLTITGLQPAETVPQNRYFAVYYDEENHKFYGTLAGIGEFTTTVDENAHPQDLNLKPTNDGAEITK